MTRNYDKGERRFKHVGRGPKPTIEFDQSHPKKWIGKCPSTLSAEERQALLDEAIASPNGDRELDVPKRVYVVHEGAIYEAQTSDRGKSYHGYPYKGKLSGTVLDALRLMATSKKCLKSFEDWVKIYIDLRGPRK